MTIRLAAAPLRFNTVITRRIEHKLSLRAANDNAMPAASNRMISEALRHFAAHGLNAAQRAHDNALVANAANDSESFDWWVSICRTLDRRMADSLLDRSKAS